MPRFSLKHLLAAMTLIGVGGSMIGFLFQIPQNGPFPNAFLVVASWLGGGALIGAGLGIPTRRPLLGALLGFVLQIGAAMLFGTVARP
jgi:hypothetical protein